MPGRNLFSWDDVCPHIISMPHSVEARSSVQKSLEYLGISRVNVWPGIVAEQREQLASLVKSAADACLVPQSYAADAKRLGTQFRKYHGTISSSLAHLRLLQHLWLKTTSNATSSAAVASSDSIDEVDASCKWALVMADDVVFHPRFKSWVEDRMNDAGSQADFVNLAVVRAWGAGVVEGSGRGYGNGETHRSAFKRVDGGHEYAQWASGMRGPYGIRSPNILVTAYMVKTSSIPTLLSAFARTDRLSAKCSIDQVSLLLLSCLTTLLLSCSLP